MVVAEVRAPAPLEVIHNLVVMEVTERLTAQQQEVVRAPVAAVAPQTLMAVAVTAHRAVSASGQ